MTDLGGWKVGAEDLLAAVLQTVAQPVWVVDPEGIFANPAAISALGYDRADELFGRHSHETIHYAHPDGTPYPAAECPMLLPRTTGETIARDLDAASSIAAYWFGVAIGIRRPSDPARGSGRSWAGRCPPLRHAGCGPT